MSEASVAAIVLAAGLGTRMRSALPKVLHGIAGRPMIGYLLERLREAQVARIVVVVGPEMDAVAAAVAPAETAVQAERLGTAHAVAAAREALAGHRGPVLIAFGDTPLIKAETLAAMRAALDGPDAPAVVVLGFRPADTGEYGRLVVADGGLQAIVEHRDATPAQRAIALCNAGLMAVSGRHLFDLVGAVGNDNAKREYYLTDIVALARARGLACAVVEAGDADEVMGINSRAELARAERIMQQRLRAAAMAAGATLADPETVYFSYDTVLGRDVTVGPQVVFGRGVRIGDDVDIRAFCHIEGATVEHGAIVGPFARLRPGAHIGRAAHIGNFVEIKEASIGTRPNVNHLSYVGDARVGAGANIGAGTITCNYDGFAKHRTDIGAGAFIGSNTALVAPVTIGDGAVVGAGSTIAKDVPPDALALTRAEQQEVRGWATKNRARKQAAKNTPLRPASGGEGGARSAPGEAGVAAGAASPTSPRPSPPPRAERGTGGR